MKMKQARSRTQRKPTTIAQVVQLRQLVPVCREVADEYEDTLAEQALEIVHNAKKTIWYGEADDAARELRNAARLLELWGQRQRARREPQRRKAARS